MLHHLRRIPGLEAERDALRAEAGRLREMLARLIEAVGWDHIAGERPRLDKVASEATRLMGSSTPLSAAVERMQLLERVVEVIRKEREATGDFNTMTRMLGRDMDEPVAVAYFEKRAAATKEVDDALAALDRTEEK